MQNIRLISYYIALINNTLAIYESRLKVVEINNLLTVQLEKNNHELDHIDPYGSTAIKIVYSSSAGSTKDVRFSSTTNSQLVVKEELICNFKRVEKELNHSINCLFFKN